jgi:hypothetical protein
MKKMLLVAVMCAAAAAMTAMTASTADAHRNLCHTYHTCPSDHHTYLWRGLSCTSKLAERKAIDKRVVKYAGIRYYCHKGK